MHSCTRALQSNSSIFMGTCSQQLLMHFLKSQYSVLLLGNNHLQLICIPVPNGIWSCTWQEMQISSHFNIAFLTLTWSKLLLQMNFAFYQLKRLQSWIIGYIGSTNKIFLFWGSYAHMRFLNYESLSRFWIITTFYLKSL